MPVVRELLDVQDSVLAGLLRSHLVGLHASLADALERAKHDPGADACVRLLRELGRELAAASPPVDRSVARSNVDSPVSAPDPPPVRPTVLPTVAALLDRPDAPSWRDRPDPATTPALLWRRLHIAALRLPAAAVSGWRAAVTAALPPPQAGVATWRTLPGDVDEILVPPYGDKPGWRTSAAEPATEDIVARLGSGGPRAELARLATCLAGMVDLDEDLLLGLESVRFHGLGSLDDSLRTAFRRELLDRLAAYGRTTHGSPASFEALLLVDEALHSVLHIPIPPAGSWWARLQDRTRKLVFEARRDHPHTEVMVLARSYREARTKTGGRNDIRHPLDGSGAVLSCLRLWAQVDGKELLGRVVWSG